VYTYVTMKLFPGNCLIGVGYVIYMFNKYDVTDDVYFRLSSS